MRNDVSELRGPFSEWLYEIKALAIQYKLEWLLGDDLSDLYSEGLSPSEALYELTLELT